MSNVLRALFRAIASLLHPRMLWLTVAPLLLAGVFWGAVMFFGWEAAIGFLTEQLSTSTWTNWLYSALDWAGLSSLRIAIAPLLLVALLIPLIVVSALWYIAWVSMPVIVRFISQRHFPHLEKQLGGSLLGGLANSLWATLLFCLLMVVLLPLWLVPPFFAIVPPILWGWLTYRVISYDALAEHASAAERKAILKQHHWPLLLMGICVGLLGSAPTFFWISSVLMVVLFPFVAIGALWMYILIFVFSGLWFGHYCLHALAVQRAPRQPGTVAVPPVLEPAQPTALPER